MPRRLIAVLTLSLLTTVFAAAQNPDKSGNGSLKGDYFIREILISGQNLNGTITSANSVIGVATLDGNGNYKFTGQGTGTGSLGTASAQSFTGTYGVAGNGFLEIQSFITTGDTCFGGVSAIGPSAFVASVTETTGHVDILVGIPAGANASNGTLKGSYTAGVIDFLNADINMIREATFNATADGAGNFGNVTVNGTAVNLGGTATAQTVSGVTYTLSGEGAGTLSFGSASASQLVSGSKTLYVSADGGIILGGTPGGYDLVVGIRALNSPATNSTSSGVYYLAGLEDLVASSAQPVTHAIQGYYGSTNANGAGTAIWHNRIRTFPYGAFDYTYPTAQYSVTPAGTFSDGQNYNYTLGANGQGFIATGTSGLYSLVVGLGAQQYSGTGVFLKPLGIVNAASYAPITNPIAPNEIVTLYGSGLATATVSAPSLPLPTTLGGVQVTVNGQAAPLIYVTPVQIAFVVPQMISPFYSVLYATVQVVNNAVKSNAVTLYTSFTAPGIFAVGGDGISGAAAQHASSGLPSITPSNPAKIGEGIVLYANGLGSVTPAVSDGAPAPSNPLSTLTDTMDEVDLGLVKSTVTFAGLTPGLAGLYQINTNVPAGTPAGNVYVSVSTPDAVTAEATLPIAASGAGSASTRTAPLAVRPHPVLRDGQTPRAQVLARGAR